MEFVDIAGLVKGASKGEGLGNQFLGHIRQVDAIVHVVRCFEDDNVVHVDGSIDPTRDREVITMELIIADLDTVDKRLARASSQAKSGDKKLFKAQVAFLEQLHGPARLRPAGPGLELGRSEPEEELMRELCLLTDKAGSLCRQCQRG